MRNFFIAILCLSVTAVVVNGQEELPEFSVSADTAVGVPMSETNCNVTLFPEGEGWELSRIVPDYVGRTCFVGPEAIRWHHYNELDYSITLTLIIEGVHTSGERTRVPFLITMENDPDPLD